MGIESIKNRFKDLTDVVNIRGSLQRRSTRLPVADQGRRREGQKTQDVNPSVFHR